MKQPLVSIIIPVYNAGEYLAECIESALEQTWENKEIIIVDDGSTDASVLVAEKYIDRLNVKLLRQQNKGASSARNYGLKESSGDFIQFLDADDLLSANKIAVQMRSLQDSATRIAICKTVHFTQKIPRDLSTYDDGWMVGGTNAPLDFVIKLYSGEDVMPGYGGLIGIHAWLTPALIIKKAGQWDERLSIDDDGEFFCRVMLASDGINYCGDAAAFYRKYDDKISLSAQKTLKAIESSVLAIDLKMEHLKKHSPDPIVDKMFSRHYWWTGVLAYPQFKSISAYCIRKAKSLKYTGEKYVGGRNGHRLAAFLGWKLARLLADFGQRTKLKWG